ncbi:putative Heat shock protein 70kD, peptide-binding domain superfamily [Helianthus annuus]|nr:putative Heat shock protein 70kD, peptide-binding domain superfamily [Helianthus annuus]
MLSPTLQVRDYEVQDSFPYSIVLPSLNHEFVLFPKGNPFPKEKMMCYTRSSRFSFKVTYSNETDFPAGILQKSNVEIEFGVFLNEHGTIEIGYARTTHDELLEA